MTKKCYPYVRFSSTRQEDGSTRARQNELIDAFVAKHGLEVDRHLEDPKTSGFRGLNATEGVLGQFLQQVRLGEIEKGSYLLIENFDRLSRDKIVRSNQIFSDLLMAGIRIVILDANKVYERDNLNLGDWVNALVEFGRANAESKRKSDFSIDAWNRNREKMRSGEIVTKKVPTWLKVENDAFVIDAEKVERINTLFKLSLSSGLQEATKKYNELFDEKLAIHQSQYLLSNRKLIGEHSPKKIHYDENGNLKRKDEGEAISNYYPVVVDEKLFYQVQEVIRSRKPFSGRYSNQRYNVFRDLIYCKWCGGTIRYMNKGERDYFICTNSMTGKCDLNSHFGQQSIRGKKLFEMFFAFTNNLNISALLEENTKADELKTELSKLVSQKDKLIPRIADFKEDLKRMILQGETIPSTYNEIVTDFENTRSNLEAAIETKTKELNKIYASEQSFEGLKENDVATIIYDKTQEAVEKRIKYNNELKKIIKHIRIDFLNTTLEIEFFNEMLRFVDESGSTLEYPKNHDYDNFDNIEIGNYDKDWINPVE
ncbi:TPA: recombinase family protein [Pseudomonas aeruginosa]